MQVIENQVADNVPSQAAENTVSRETTLQVICDRCKKHIGSLETTQRTLKKGFLEIGITCPYCGFWGHGYYTTPKLEMDHKALDNFKAKARLSTFDRRKYEKKLVEFQRKYEKVQAQAGKLVRKAPVLT